jgi:hypothetical protein
VWEIKLPFACGGDGVDYDGQITGAVCILLFLENIEGKSADVGFKFTMVFCRHFRKILGARVPSSPISHCQILVMPEALVSRLRGMYISYCICQS